MLAGRHRPGCGWRDWSNGRSSKSCSARLCRGFRSLTAVAQLARLEGHEQATSLQGLGEASAVGEAPLARLRSRAGASVYKGGVRELGRVGATIAAASSSCSRASTFASSALAFARSASTVSCASFTTSATDSACATSGVHTT